MSESSIKLLSEDLINKIAAGEVVERPASVVKELVENAIDAGATSIVVDIEDSGKKLIRVSDNGKGMTQKDAEKCVMRHATSKLKTVEDLYAISTLGFRGEALSSMAAVSQLSIITKTQEQFEGYNLVFEGGNKISSGIIAAEQGTTIEIRNIFFNTPARKKFLKTDSVEMRHIIDVVTHYTLCNSQVSFKLTHEGHLLINSPIVENQQDNIGSIYGVNTAKNLLKLEYQDQFISISGYIGPPYEARNDKNQQVFFVNGRWIKSLELTKAVYDGYHSMLFVSKHPTFVLHLTMQPNKVDVNIHPQKSEIKIEQSEIITKSITQAVHNTLREYNLIPIVNVEEQLTFGRPVSKPQSVQQETKYNYEPSKQAVLHVREKAVITNKEQLHDVLTNVINADDFEEDDGIFQEEEPPMIIEQPQQQIHTEKFPPLKIMGQVHKTFFVAETPGGLFYLDQHATHERVLYEKFMQQFMGQNVEIQTLLQPDIIEFTVAQRVLIQEHQHKLHEYGFQLEHFGENSYVLKTKPLVFNRIQSKEIIVEFLQSLALGKNTLEEFQETIITRMACRAAHMAGDELTTTQMETVIKELAKCKDPFTCPHGRPTMIKVESSELEKKFRRC
jgi:DNA mismatch repair protein MutL